MDIIQSLLVTFGPILTALAIGIAVERLAPHRANLSDSLRWLHSALLYLFGVIFAFLLVPVGILGVVTFTDLNQLGLLQQVALPAWLALLIGIAALDFGEWLSHYMMHRVPLLWRFHRTHHSDEHLDMATSLRFHPLETILRYSFQLLIVMLMGVGATAVVIYGVTIIVFNAWEHANARMPRRLHALHHLIVTPVLHRVHHSDRPDHMHKNFGVFLSIWDRIAGTKVVTPHDAQLSYGLGDDRIKGERDTLFGLVVLPFLPRKQRSTAKGNDAHSVDAGSDLRVK